MTNWTHDPGYSGEETARLGDYAAVICPPDFTDDGSWGYQIFDEADDDALEEGRAAAQADGIPDAATAKRLATIHLEGLAGTRA